MTTFRAVYLGILVVALALPGCDGSAPSGPSVSGPSGPSAPALPFEAGFVDLEPFDFPLRAQTVTAQPGRLWYAFQPADDAPETKPLAVFFNGGPGASTSALLFGYGTAKWTLDANGRVVRNPDSWTRFANLLYVDARQTGFSYDRIDDVEDSFARLTAFEGLRPGMQTDGAEILRVILQVLDSHPLIQGNSVVLVGESYGGVRATWILQSLFHYRAFENRDPALLDAIQAHYDAVFPDLAGEQVPPARIAKQFGAQVLIQPYLGAEQKQYALDILSAPAGLFSQLGEETGHPFCGTNCDPPTDWEKFLASIGRDPYNIEQAAGWYDRLEGASYSALTDVPTLGTLLGTDPTKIGGLSATERTGAFRMMDTAAAFPADSSSFVSVFGALPEWDRYFVSESPPVNSRLIDWESDSLRTLPEAFLENVAHVRTFITNARNDAMWNALGIPPMLEHLGPGVAGVDVVLSAAAGVERPGAFTIRYVNATVGSRTIRFPTYAHSGHTVSACEPKALADDVEAWLAER